MYKVKAFLIPITKSLKYESFLYNKLVLENLHKTKDGFLNVCGGAGEAVGLNTECLLKFCIFKIR